MHRTIGASGSMYDAEDRQMSKQLGEVWQNKVATFILGLPSSIRRKEKGKRLTCPHRMSIYHTWRGSISTCMRRCIPQTQWRRPLLLCRHRRRGKWMYRGQWSSHWDMHPSCYHHPIRIVDLWRRRSLGRYRMSPIVLCRCLWGGGVRNSIIKESSNLNNSLLLYLISTDSICQSSTPPEGVLKHGPLHWMIAKSIRTRIRNCGEANSSKKLFYNCVRTLSLQRDIHWEGAVALFVAASMSVPSFPLLARSFTSLTMKGT